MRILPYLALMHVNPYTLSQKVTWVLMSYDLSDALWLTSYILSYILCPMVSWLWFMSQTLIDFTVVIVTYVTVRWYLVSMFILDWVYKWLSGKWWSPTAWEYRGFPLLRISLNSGTSHNLGHGQTIGFRTFGHVQSFGFRKFPAWQEPPNRTGEPHIERLFGAEFSRKHAGMSLEKTFE